MRAVEVRSKESRDGGATWFAGIFSDGLGAQGSGRTPPWQYTFYLEFGWTAQNGRHYQYPWATISVQEAAAQRRLGRRLSSPKGVFIDA